MAYTSVFDKVESNLKSEWSIYQYMQDPVKWDKLVTGIVKLKAVGTYSMQLNGRMDTASYNIYKGNPQLDWILMIYNGIKRVGSDEPIKNTKAIELTLDGGQQEIFDVMILHQDLVFVYAGQSYHIYTDSVGDFVDLSGGTTPTIYIIYNDNKTVTIKNVSAIRYRFHISYVEYLNDDYLMAGQQILYPDYDDAIKLVRQINTEQNQTTSGFARL